MAEEDSRRAAFLCNKPSKSTSPTPSAAHLPFQPFPTLWTSGLHWVVHDASHAPAGPQEPILPSLCSPDCKGPGKKTQGVYSLIIFFKCSQMGQKERGGRAGGRKEHRKEGWFSSDFPWLQPLLCSPQYLSLTHSLIMNCPGAPGPPFSTPLLPPQLHLSCANREKKKKNNGNFRSIRTSSCHLQSFHICDTT